MADTKYLVEVGHVGKILGQSDTRIVDCRFQLTDPGAGRAAFLSGHIPGAVYADLDRDLSSPVGPDTGRHPLPDARKLAATFEQLGISNTTRVIVYDEGAGAIAARAWWLLRWLGHENAAILDGGFHAWKAGGLPVEEGATDVSPGKFEARLHPEMVLRTEDVLAAGPSAGPLMLVDVRSEERFRGLEEPIDSVAGHIPGSANLPYTDLVDDEGRWRPVDAIRRRVSEALGPPADQRWSVMCGSGVTACHLVAAGLMAGYPEPRVYVGSWSEWIRDPGRPVAQGPAGGAVPEGESAEDS